MVRKSQIAICLLFVWVFLLSGCLSSRDQGCSYDKDVENIENRIVNELGDYLVIKSFNPNVYLASSSKYKGKLAEWNVCFRNEYIYDATKTNLVSPAYVVNRIREIYNQYVSNCSNYFLKDYGVRFIFNIVNKNNPSYIRYACISNIDFELWKPYENELSVVKLYVPKSDGLHSLFFDEWDYFYNCSDIEVAQMDDSTLDQIIEVADNMPFLKYIAVRDHWTANEASKLRPEVKFVSIE